MGALYFDYLTNQDEEVEKSPITRLFTHCRPELMHCTVKAKHDRNILHQLFNFLPALFSFLGAAAVNNGLKQSQLNGIFKKIYHFFFISTIYQR